MDCGGRYLLKKLRYVCSKRLVNFINVTVNSIMERFVQKGN